MTILQKIAEAKRAEVAHRKALYPIALLEKSISFDVAPVSLTRYLLRPDKSGIIAEFKRQSPSKGVINAYARIEEVSIGYMRAGASALSVLTDRDFFGGSSEDLTSARSLNYSPILRKDFIIDPYQIIESKSMGADAILLIAAILSPDETLALASLARSLGMETILEVHNCDELKHLNQHISIVGVNSRNLHDFSVSLDTALAMKEFLPDDIPAVAESGINDPADLMMLRQAGYQGFLIGELFMRHSDPSLACHDFIKKISQIS